MALWIHNRPVEHCHAGELETAEFLALLSDDWLVRWGYFYLDSYHGISRQHLLGRSELVHFARTWDKRFQSTGIHPDRRSREIFFATRFGREAKPKAVRHFTDEIDRRLARQTEANYELLDQLALNRQMIFQGGPGSGKTWMALE